MMCIRWPTAAQGHLQVALKALVCLCATQALLADEKEDIEFFERRIRPVLIQSCYECHSAASEELEGELYLDSRDGILRGGEQGPILVPGDPQASRLIAALRYDSLQMPPSNRLPEAVIRDFEDWIARGAVDPRDSSDSLTSAGSWEAVLAARRDWWSLRPVSDPRPPDLSSQWPRQTLDRFVLANLHANDLRPAPRQGPRRLLRRLSFVLTGLPPTADEMDRFVRAFGQNPDAAYARVVDRLLASPAFGERWARHWMDVVRFTETHGNEWNYEVHHAWRYRDYLIRAWNQDVSYDQFVLEHLAGDLLPTPRTNRIDQINESVIGTSFYRFGEVSHDDCVTLTSLGYDILDNQIDTLSKAFQATTIACARCHDHKIDAVSMADYYALLGILKSSRLTAHTIDLDSVNAPSLTRMSELKRAIKAEVVSEWLANLEDMDELLLRATTDRAPEADTSASRDEPQERRLAAWESALKSSDSIDKPLWIWNQLDDASGIAEQWRQLRERVEQTQKQRRTFNRESYTPFADFREPGLGDWTAAGPGLKYGGSRSGEFTIALEGDQAIGSILPAGCFTHQLSDKLNGTLQSPPLTTDRRRISAYVLGDNTSAFRLVSNNCQLNYANYRALTFSRPQWVTFEVPESAEALGTFAELVTRFHNPKFPDQLGTLGGDRTNDRRPWSEAASDPRSYFGILRVVLHDVAEPPKADLTPLLRLWRSPSTVNTRQAVALRYVETIRAAVEAWGNETASDADVYWLSWLCEHRLLEDSLATNAKLAVLVDEYRVAEGRIRTPRVTAGVSDAGFGRDHPRFERGDSSRPGEPVRRRYLDVLGGEAGFEGLRGSGRLALAKTIASTDNPLTGRVIVNRVWHYLMGRGLVASVDDFGQMGDLPTHPKLLDHLATRFVRPISEGGMGWSIKRLVREIVLSSTFQMTSEVVATNLERDPQNLCWHHYPVRRLEAEAVRDTLLAVSGRLRQTMYGLSVQPFRETANDDRRLFAGPLDGDGRRSLYIKVNLMEGPEFLSSFNLPGGKVTQGRRDVTNVPNQALTLMNDPFVAQQAEFWATELCESSDDSVATRLSLMFKTALGRPPKDTEVRRFRTLIQALARWHETKDGEASIMIQTAIWKDVAHVLFNSKEFVYIP